MHYLSHSSTAAVHERGQQPRAGGHLAVPTFIDKVLLTRQRGWLMRADDAVFFRSFSTGLQAVLRRRVLHRFVGTFHISCRCWQDNSSLTRGGHSPLAFRYGP